VTFLQRVTFCELGLWGKSRDYELQGVKEARKVEEHVIDIVVMSMDKVSEELLNVSVCQLHSIQGRYFELVSFEMLSWLSQVTQMLV